MWGDARISYEARTRHKSSAQNSFASLMPLFSRTYRGINDTATFTISVDARPQQFVDAYITATIWSGFCDDLS